MGQSTDGLLWFGLCWTEKDEKYYDHGVPDPVLRHLKPRMDELEEIDEEDTYALVEYVNKLIKEFGCKLLVHCSGDYPMIALALEEHYHAASRGYPEELDASKLQSANTAVNVDKLQKAAEMIGWPWKEPQWWLASYWG